jgi:hypothetical protein
VIVGAGGVLVLLDITVAIVVITRSSARDTALREAEDRGATVARIMRP